MTSCVGKYFTRFLPCKKHILLWSSVPVFNHVHLSLKKSIWVTHTAALKCNVQNFHQPSFCDRNIKDSCFEFQQKRFFGRISDAQRFNNKTVLIYVSALVVLVGGLSYAAVPLYRIYCQATGKGGQAVLNNKEDKVETMKPNVGRIVTVHFNADTAASLQWNFKPQQRSIKVFPGETVLAFYTAKNPTDVPVDGIATYNVIPFEAGQYFNKIQCFCFEEQRLNPHEQVDMPVFFYIDPEFTEDPKMEYVNDLTLSYTFFEAKEGLELPLPGTK